MLICTCPIDEKCPAIGSNCDCFPWCDYLFEDGVSEYVDDVIESFYKKQEV